MHDVVDKHNILYYTTLYNIYYMLYTRGLEHSKPQYNKAIVYAIKAFCTKQ